MTTAACGHVWFGPRQLAPCATNPHPHRSLCLARHIISSAISLSSVLPAALTHVMDGDCITPFPPLRLQRKIQFLYNRPCYFFVPSIPSFLCPLLSPFTTFFSPSVCSILLTLFPVMKVSSLQRSPLETPPPAVTAAAKKQYNTRSRAIRIATIVKNIGSKKWNENEMLTTPLSSP